MDTRLFFDKAIHSEVVLNEPLHVLHLVKIAKSTEDQKREVLVQIIIPFGGQQAMNHQGLLQHQHLH